MSLLDSDAPFPFYPDASGAPLQGGSVYFGASGQNPVTNPITVYWDEAGTQPASQPISISNGRTMRNGTPARVWINGDYSRLVQDTNGRMLVYEATPPTSWRTLLSASTGSSLVGFVQAGTGAVARTGQDKMREDLSILDYHADGSASGAMVDPTGAVDSTGGILAAIAQAVATGRKLRAPAGTYKITSPLVFSSAIDFEGDGSNKTIFNVVSAAVVQSITVSAADNTAIVGMRLRGFKVICNGGAAVCDGVYLSTTAVNSAISQSVFEDINIQNARKAVTRNGVIYMSTFKGITIGGVTEHGWFDTGALEIIYNKHQNIEVTGVGNGAYAVYGTSAASQWETITADGPCYFAGAYTSVNGISVEANGALMPAPPGGVTAVIQCNQIASLENVAIINVPNAKYGIGIYANGNINVMSVRFPDAGAGNQPNRPIYFDPGAKGLLANVKMDRTCVTKLSQADLAGMIAIGCDDITDFSFKYSGGTWVPDFSTWATPPTVVAATWERLGSTIKARIYAHEGICVDYSHIGGLPVAAGTLGGIGVMSSSNDVTKRFTCSIIPTASIMQSVPAQTLTGIFWQLVADYSVA